MKLIDNIFTMHYAFMKKEAFSLLFKPLGIPELLRLAWLGRLCILI
jgi:hypothetical protein